MTMRTSTHTYALVSVTQEMFDCVKLQLEEAGYDHALIRDGEQMVIDMHGLALIVGPAQTVPQYAVIKQGVYIQDVHGSFVRLDDARAQAQKNALEDRDDYHSHDVWTFSAEDGLLEQVAGYRQFRPERGRFSETALLWGDAIKENKARRTPF